MDSYPARLLVSFIFILVIGMLRLAQVSVDNSSEARVSKMAKSDNAQKLLKRLEKSSRIYNGIRFLIIIFELLISANISLLVRDFAVKNSFVEYLAWLIPVTLIVAAFIIQLIGICIPKKIASKNPEKMLFAMSWLISLTYIITLPFERLLSIISSLVLLPFGVAHTDEDDEVTEEEIRFMVDVGSESGAIDPDEKEMIHNIFELDDTPVRDVMTHRTDVVFLWKDEDINTWETTITTTNHTVYPVCGETVDDILGFIKATDFYKYLRNTESFADISNIIRNPYLVPESIKADDLFRQMQKAKNHFAIVLDEYGGLAGIITMSDLLEEIVGDLDNDTDNTEEEITQIDSNTWKILGSTDIDTVSKTLDTELPIEEYNTFAGMILGELGAIPDDGTTAEIEAYGLQIKVTKVFEHRIDEALVCKIEQPTDE